MKKQLKTNLIPLFLFFLVNELNISASNFPIKRPSNSIDVAKVLIDNEYNTIGNIDSKSSIINSNNIHSSIFFNANTSTIPAASFANSLNSCNGVHTQGEILNKGNISTFLTLKGRDSDKKISENSDANASISANGIFAIGKVSNSGDISTFLLAEGGDALYHAKAVASMTANGIYSKENVINTGDISTILNFNGGNASIGSGSDSFESGNGIFTIEDTKNSGYISTNLFLDGRNSNADASMSGNGIRAIGEVSNKGNIVTNLVLNGGKTNTTSHASANSSSSSNGIHTFRNVSNSGNILTNLFLNAGSSSLDAYAFSSVSGNGIYTHGDVSNSGDISTNLILKGGNSNIPTSTFTNALFSGNGIYTHGNVYNSGNISTNLDLDGGSSHSSITNSGNGVYSLERVTNIGVLSSYLFYNTKNYIKNIFSGNGVAGSEYVSNLGVIKGVQNAITPNINNSTINNYGILAGKNIIGGYNPGNFSDYGTTVTIKEDLKKNIIIDSITSSKNVNYSVKMRGEPLVILNSQIYTVVTPDNKKSKDSFIPTNNISRNYKNSIINGAGYSTGVLTLKNNSNLLLDNSIVNAYKTAITLNNNSSLAAKDSIFNGGGIKGNDPIIISEGDNTSISMKDNSIINGNILIKGKNSSVIVENLVVLNGDIISSFNNVGNKIQLGDSSNKNTLNISKSIKNFDQIKIVGNVNLLHNSEVNKGNIDISNGKLNVMLDTNKRDSNGKIIGHALYNHDGKITIIHPVTPSLVSSTTDTLDSNSNLIFSSNSLNVKEVIAMNKTDLSSISNRDIGTNSLLHTANKRADGDIEIDINNWKDIVNTNKPSSLNSNNLENIYNNILNSRQLNLFSPTTNLSDARTDSFSQLASLMDQIDNNNPYSYGGLMSKYSLNTFREGIYYSSHIMPQPKDYISSQQVLYSYNKYHSDNYSSSSNTSGLLGTVEYGLPLDSSIGFAIGGVRQKLNMDYSSNLKSDVMYLGIFYKNNMDNIKFISGLGYQYSVYESERNISNKYQSFNNNGEFNTNSFNFYEQVKYNLIDNKKLKIEPKIKLSYTYVKQESITEDNSPLAIDVKQSDYNYFDSEIGVDFTKEILITNGLIRLTSNISYINSQGDSSKKLQGKMKNSENNFDIQCQSYGEHNGKLGFGIDIEKDSGMLYFLGTDISFSSENQKNINLRLGLGYSF